MQSKKAQKHQNVQPVGQDSVMRNAYINHSTQHENEKGKRVSKRTLGTSETMR